MTPGQKSILVTGATGLVGSHLLYSLTANGERPKALYRNEAKKEFVRKVFSYYSNDPDTLFNSIEWIYGDIDNNENLSKVVQGSTQVYNCAAQVSFDPSHKDKIIENNVRIARNIVRACAGHTDIKLTHVSSVAAIGGNKKRNTISEYQEWNDSDTHSTYAISKHLSEEVVWESIRNGLNAVIVNPSVIFGPGDWDHGSSLYFSKIRKGMPFYTNGVTGYVDVRDVVNTMIILMNSPVSGERFIISSGNLSFREIFFMIAKNLHAIRPFIYMPEPLSGFIVKIIKAISELRGKSPAITAENIRSAYLYQNYDNTRISEISGISFMPVSKSIEDTCRIYNKELKQIEMSCNS